MQLGHWETAGCHQSWPMGLGTWHCHPSPPLCLQRELGHLCRGYGGFPNRQGTVWQEALSKESFQELMSFSTRKLPRLTLPVWDLQPPGSTVGAQQSSPNRLLSTQKPQLHSQHVT